MHLHFPSVADVLTLPVSALAAVLFTVAMRLNSVPDPKPFTTECTEYPRSTEA